MREKIELRKQVRALRDAASAEMRARWSAEICARAMAHPAYVRARTVHIFLSFQSEVDTRAIIEHVQASGRRVVVPVFLKDSDETPATQIDTLDLAAFDLGRWGMRTPKLRRDVLLDEIDLVFVPLLVWAPTDEGRCTRVGYGAGYYDRLLTRVRPHVPRIGLAFALQRVERLPIETHDQMLDEVLHDSFVRNPTFVIRRS
ncbi:MAG: 5-formyltetrahydrofolate cyclo-ligase [Chloroflexi bacterium]|nr:5-formyltetrahydrofolate cyclo-ligase [Chloroflexota bacterium]